MTQLRDTLFGDLPLESWPPPGAAVEDYSWSAFAAARTSLAAGDRAAALESWREVTARSELESRHHLQAWHFLREQGQDPPTEEAKRVLGIVVEVALAEGLDLLAAYADRSARYYRFSGTVVVWERPDATLDGAIDELLDTSGQVIQRFGPWVPARLPAPPPGQARLSFLTPSGLHMAQAPLQNLAADPLGGPVLHLAMRLMQALLAKTKAS